MGNVNASMTARAVEEFWSARPCNSGLSHREVYSREYFLDIEAKRYSLESHIPGLIDRLDVANKDVLEIGAGVGTDGRRIAALGGRYTGINIDAGSTDMTRRAFEVFGLQGDVRQASATAMPFADRSFDRVYSFGVLLHIPEVDKAMAEIKRVLRPGGTVMAMVYNRSSINYQLEIRILRRMLRRALVVPGAISVFSALGLPREKLQRHAELIREVPNMSEEEWLSRNTDGPDNPYATVYDRREAERLFDGFQILANEAHFFDYRHWGVLGRAMPTSALQWLGRRWGWHRMVHARLPQGG